MISPTSPSLRSPAALPRRSTPVGLCRGTSGSKPFSLHQRVRCEPDFLVMPHVVAHHASAGHGRVAPAASDCIDNAFPLCQSAMPFGRARGFAVVVSGGAMLCVRPHRLLAAGNKSHDHPGDILDQLINPRSLAP
jgi:hypothetical protein